MIGSENTEIIDNISIEYIDNYSIWLKLLWGLYNEFQSIEVCNYLSRRGTDYCDATQKINSDIKQSITFGTVRHYSRLSNEENYINIISKYIVDLKPTEESLSNAFLKLVDGDICYNNGKIYVYEHEWKCDEKKYILKKKIRVILNTYIKKKLNEIDEEDDEAPIKNTYLTEILKKVQQRKTIDNVAEFTIQTLGSKQTHIKFDISQEQLYNIHFKNGCYELKTKTFRKRTKMDYVTEFLDWEYNDNVDNKYIEEVELFFKKIHVNKDDRNFCISWLASCLDGSLSKNKFKMNLGESAENGKSTEFNVHSKVFDIYSNKLSSTFFNMDNNKRHKELLRLLLKPIRFAFIEELKTKKLDADIIKEMCDGRMVCDVLYSEAISGTIQATINTCSNRFCNIDLDKGVLRRILLQEYTSSFSRNNTEDNFETKTFKPDLHFIDKFDDENMKNAYFQVLLKHYKVNIDIPQKYVDNFADMAEEFDEFGAALSNITEKTEHDEDRIHKDDFMNAMIEAGCGTRVWREILSNMKSRGYKYGRQLKTNGKQGCFVGIKFK